ncbi:MAG: hypothetical protein P8Y94_09045, partial [Acidobacteriota bacterium]
MKNRLVITIAATSGLLISSASFGTDVELRSWKVLPYSQLFFQDEAVGWVAGRVGIARTVDGGHSWEALNRTLPVSLMDAKGGDPVKSGNPVKSVYVAPLISSASFVDGDTAWVIARWHNILHTSDGGQTWTDLTPDGLSLRRFSTGESIPYLYYLQFVDSDHGWLMVHWDSVGGVEDTRKGNTRKRELFRTQDGGAHWESVADLRKWDEQLLSFQFVDQERGWALRSGSDSVVKTADGGLTWSVVTGLREMSEEQHFHPPRSSFTDAEIAFDTDGDGWVLGNSG